MLDTFFIPSYATASLALVQYHTWARRKDSQAIESLRILKDVVKRWEVRRPYLLFKITRARLTFSLLPSAPPPQAVVQPTPGAVHPMAVRHKTLEIMGLLYTAAKHTSPHPTGASPTAYQTHATSPSAFDGTGAETETEERTLNPTTGVVSRGEWIGQRVTFWKDPTMPGGGVFAAEDAVRKKVAQDGQDVSEPQAQEDGGGALAMTGIESGADGAPASAGSAAGPSTSSRASFGSENVFNVNPHIQVRRPARCCSARPLTSLRTALSFAGHRPVQHGRGADRRLGRRPDVRRPVCARHLPAGDARPWRGGGRRGRQRDGADGSGPDARGLADERVRPSFPPTWPPSFQLGADSSTSRFPSQVRLGPLVGVVEKLGGPR